MCYISRDCCSGQRACENQGAVCRAQIMNWGGISPWGFSWACPWWLQPHSSVVLLSIFSCFINLPPEKVSRKAWQVREVQLWCFGLGRPEWLLSGGHVPFAWPSEQNLTFRDTNMPVLMNLLWMPYLHTTKLSCVQPSTWGIYTPWKIWIIPNILPETSVLYHIQFSVHSHSVIVLSLGSSTRPVGTPFSVLTAVKITFSCYFFNT